MVIRKITDAVTEFLKQVSKLHELVDSVTTDYERFFFNEAGRAIYDFFWSDFADWYESYLLPPPSGVRRTLVHLILIFLVLIVTCPLGFCEYKVFWIGR